ncbi:MAG: xanthan lyase [Bacteroidaceae bacterium]|nr:xanthan lyase [Bacteroidaceae bacterium]
MRKLCMIASMLLLAMGVQAQSIERTVEERLTNYFKEYLTPEATIGVCKLDSFKIDHERRTLRVYANPTFGYQSFTKEITDGIYQQVRQILPGPVNYFDITLYADGRKIQELIPNALRAKRDREEARLWDGRRHKDAPWVTRASRPYEVEKGLEGHHLAVWQSHGRHFKNARGEWAWQRPPLFCTTEDLFTQSFVVPYIIPMLENAGANVFTPRERDTQRHEVIVDNDGSHPGSIYYEEKARKAPWKNSSVKGFAYQSSAYKDGDAPFLAGTGRYTTTSGRKKNTKTLATWIPDIPETGAYAVYVSYQTLPDAVPDAHYTVFHKGGTTEFYVNQRMGGGTWVYLGTFEFDKGQNDYGFVALSNESNTKGTISADAVRFGGGMGDIQRGGVVSGFPRYLEGARYWSQWAGMPYEVYAGYKGENDYNDDINTRSRTVNYLSGGSVYNPKEEGLRVPIEMTLGVHSDAGFSREDELVGSLGIYTTAFNDGKLATGVLRYASRDLNDLVLTGLQRDLSAYMGQDWVYRGMWDKNYSESRLPVVPSMILETLSHQNFADLKWGHDPNFKFTLGRSVYKSILRFVATQHGRDYVVQPLPVNNFAIRFTSQPKPVAKRGQKQENATIQLSWRAVDDPLEPSAKAKGYVVYTRIGYGGFDNGEYVKEPRLEKEIEPGLVYSFKVTAVNEGGESFPSEVLSAFQAPESNETLLIVNGFDRLSGPATIENPVEQGFDLRQDAGVPYIYSTSFCGAQQGFDRQYIGRETPEGLGYSGNELEGMKVAGNTFDYPFVHGKAIQAVGGYSFVSCSDEAVENGRVRLTDYPVVDFILGVEKTGGHSAMSGEVYQALSATMQKTLADYLKDGGRLFASGSHIGSDPTYHTAGGANFLADKLKLQVGTALALPPVAGSRDMIYTSQVRSAHSSFTIPRTLNEQSLAIPAPETLIPVAPAYAALAYEEGNQCAAIAYPGSDYRTFVLGFPFESIREESERVRLMSMILRFLRG